jgi:RND family efflux transporter MFP subunit
MKYINTILLAMIVPAIYILSGCSSHQPAPETGTGDNPIPVTLGTPSSRNNREVSASGHVESMQTAAISTRVMGTITHLYAKIGDKVAKGQLLATISSQDIDARRAQSDAQISAASASLDNAKKDFDRFSRLYAVQSATASELDNATLRYHAAQATLKAAQQMRSEVDATLAYTRLTAPFDGTITEKMKDEGSMATPGMPLLMLEQGGPYQVSVSVAESDIRNIRPGAKVSVTIPSINKTAEGVVTQLNTSSVATGGQYLVKVSLPAETQQGLLAGMFVHVSIAGTTSIALPGNADTQEILIPVSALVHNDQLTGIYTVSNTHTALLRWIRTGKTSGDQIEVLSGLGPDESFIMHADGKLYNGAPVMTQ